QSGENILASSASLNFPSSVTVDAFGAIYIGESGRIRKITTDGLIHTISTGSSSSFYSPHGLLTDGLGNLYESDSSVVYKFTPVPSFCSYTVPTPGQQLSSASSLNIAITTAAGCTW